MNITKYGHACFTVEKDGEFLVVDPGNLSPDFVSPEHVVAVLITHEHADHLDHDHLSAIIDKNPDAVIIGPEHVVSQIEVFETRAVTGGDSVSVGNFDLKFFGHTHAVIHSSIPVVENVAVLINELIYYPGDSLTVPDTSVTVLALPVSAPWLKIGEAIDFLEAVHPSQAFPVHDALYTPAGLAIVNRLMTARSEALGIDYHPLQPGESLTV